MRVSIITLALTGCASTLPALGGLTNRHPTDLASRKIESKGAEAPSLVNDMSLSRVETVTVREEPKANTRKRSMEVEPSQAPKKSGNATEEGNPRAEAIGDNKENPTTGLTDSEAAEIVSSIDFKDKKAAGSIGKDGKRNPLPGLNADMTDAIIKQGQAALKEAGAS